MMRRDGSGATRRAGGPACRGFTILELMIVLVLLGVLAAMILPAFNRSYRDAVLRSDARKLAAAMSLAYSQSVTLGRVHRLCVAGAERRWWLELQEDGRDRAFVPALGVPGGAGELDGAVQATVREPLESGRKSRAAGGETEERRELSTAAAERGREEEPAVIAFRPDGTAEAREVLLEDGDGFALAVRVHPSTSRVRVVEIDREALR
jgi:type II secretion system protein H